MKNLSKENMNIAVRKLKQISETDLADLCSITEQAIRAGGGFGWLTIPPIETLKKLLEWSYFNKDKHFNCWRLNGTIAGALQISFNPPK